MIYKSADVKCGFSIDVTKKPLYAGNNFIVCSDSESPDYAVRFYAHENCGRECYLKYKKGLELIKRNKDSLKNMDRSVLYPEDMEFKDIHCVMENGRPRQFSIIKYSYSAGGDVRLSYNRFTNSEKTILLEKLLNCFAKYFLLEEGGKRIIAGFDVKTVTSEVNNLFFSDFVFSDSPETITNNPDVIFFGDDFFEFFAKFHHYLNSGNVDNNIESVCRKDEMIEYILNNIAECASLRQLSENKEPNGLISNTDYIETFKNYETYINDISPRRNNITAIKPELSAPKSYSRYRDFVGRARGLRTRSYNDLRFTEADYEKLSDKKVVAEIGCRDLDYDVKDGELVIKGGKTVDYGIEPVEEGGATVFEFQMEAARTFLNRFNGNGILADQVGMGKTIETGIIISEFAAHEDVSRRWKSLLIVVPKGEQKAGDEGEFITQWKNEMATKFGLALKTLSSSFSGREPLLDRVGPLFKDGKRNMAGKHPCFPACIMTYGTFRQQWSIYEKLGRMPEIDMVIIDEAHRLVTSKQRTTAKLKLEAIKKAKQSGEEPDNVDIDSDLFSGASFKLLSGIRKKYCVLVTATPHRGDLVMLYPYIKLLRPDDYRDMYDFYERACYNCTTVSEINARYGSSGLTKIRELLSVIAIRRTREDTRYSHKNPGGVKWRNKHSEVFFFIDSDSNRQRKIRNSLFRETSDLNGSTVWKYILPDSGFVRRENVNIVGYEKADPAVKDEFGDIDKVKIKKLSEIINAHPEEQIVVFFSDEEILSTMNASGKTGTAAIALFHKLLEKELNKHKVKRRFFSSLSEFKEDSKSLSHNDILLVDSKSSEGMNIQYAHVLVSYHILNCPMKMEQRIGRIDRIGQTHEMQIYSFAEIGALSAYLLTLYDRDLELFSQWNGDITNTVGSVFEDDGDDSSDSSFEKIVTGEWKNCIKGGEAGLKKWDEFYTTLTERIVNTLSMERTQQGLEPIPAGIPGQEHAAADETAAQQSTIDDELSDPEMLKKIDNFLVNMVF